ncbi:hypothetical protein, partial [Streptomyces sp. NPDC003952]
AAALATAIEAARERRKDDDRARELGLCQLAVCRGQVRTVWKVDPDGDVQPYGYCTSCGMPVS